MLKQGIKNYFKNLKHFFTPLGAMFLGLVFGLSVFFPVLSAAFSQLAHGVNNLAEQFNVDFNQLFKSLFSSIGGLDWSSPLDALKTMFSHDWLKTSVGKSLEALLGVDYQTFAEQISNLIGEFSSQVKLGFAALILFFTLGVVGGYYLTAFLVRRNIARRAWWKFFLAYLVDFVINSALLALGVWLAILWKYSAIIFVFVAFALSGLTSLINAYVMQGYQKVSFQQVVNFKNAMQYMLSALLVWLINLALCIFVTVVTNNLVAAVVAIALIEIAIPVNKLNAEAYVKSLADAAERVAEQSATHTDKVGATAEQTHAYENSKQTDQAVENEVPEKSTEDPSTSPNENKQSDK